jgi:fucose 4-O-acetylase-like acetyltransferase
MVRNPFYDNLKYIVITLVVVGHVVEPLIDKIAWTKTLYISIYSFHIPMFAMISGRFSNTFTESAHYTRLMAKILFPYIVLELMYSSFHHFIFHTKELSVGFLVPYWILWYLMSLFLWRVMLPFFVQLKYPVVIAIILGLSCGLSSQFGYTLSFSRTFVFFPFFLVGYFLRNNDIAWIHFNKVRALTLVLICSFVAIISLTPLTHMDVRWLYGSYPYGQLGAAWYLGILARGTIYIAATVVGLAVMSLTPCRKCLFTSFGMYSMYAYLLHGFIVKLAIASGMYESIESLFQITLMIISAILLTMILTIKPVRLITNSIIYPKYIAPGLFKRDPSFF